MTVEQDVVRALGRWAAGSVVLGAALSADPRTRGFGRQTAAWGVVDGATVLVQGAFLLWLDASAARRLSDGGPSGG